MPKRKLTEAVIKKLSIPKPIVLKSGPSKGKERPALVLYYDTDQQSLAVGVSSTGVKSYYFIRKCRNRLYKRVIERCENYSLQRAKKKAQEWNIPLRDGIDPFEQEAKDRAQQEAERANTLGKLFEEYMTKHAMKITRRWEKEQARFEQYLAHLADTPITEITKSVIRDLHVSVGSQHPYAANRILQLVSAVFNWADRPNPAKGIKRFPEHARDRFLDVKDLPKFAEAVNHYPDDRIRDFIWLSLLTGARKTNVMSMKWSDINLEKGEWIISAEETKTNKPYLIPLSEPAVEILNRRLKSKCSKFVFPGSGTSGHLTTIKKAWKKICDDAEIEDLRPHDLRRTFGSWLASSGESLVTIGKALQHKSIKATSVYAHLQTDVVKRSFEKIGKVVGNAATVESPD